MSLGSISSLVRHAMARIVAVSLLTAVFASVLGVASATAPATVFAQDTTNTVTVETVPGDTVTSKVLQKAHSSWPWYLVRGSGIVAAVALVLLMVSGIGQMTGYTYRVLEPLTAWASHRALGLVFGVSVLIHMGGLLFDHFLPFTLGELLIPWLSDYKPVHLLGLSVGSLYVAMGVIAFYLTWVIVITSLTIISKRSRLWKLVHLLSYVVIALVFVHAVYLGTDVSHGWMRIAWIALAIGVLGLSGLRSWRAYTT